MDNSLLRKNVELLLKQYNSIREVDFAKLHALNARSISLINSIEGKGSPFATTLQNADGAFGNKLATSKEVLIAFVDHIESGFGTSISYKRKAEVDVISDFLDQAQQLLDNKNIHPAAAAVLVGATLEEYLRSWVENEAIDISGKTPTIDGYTKALREVEIISKQDVKDITSWTGIRNAAAHGDWGELSDRSRVRLMLEGVNLFMRRYTKET